MISCMTIVCALKVGSFELNIVKVRYHWYETSVATVAETLEVDI